MKWVIASMLLFVIYPATQFPTLATWVMGHKYAFGVHDNVNGLGFPENIIPSYSAVASHYNRAMQHGTENGFVDFIVEPDQAHIVVVIDRDKRASSDLYGGLHLRPPFVGISHGTGMSSVNLTPDSDVFGWGFSLVAQDQLQPQFPLFGKKRAFGTSEIGTDFGLPYLSRNSVGFATQSHGSKKQIGATPSYSYRYNPYKSCEDQKPPSPLGHLLLSIYILFGALCFAGGFYCLFRTVKNILDGGEFGAYSVKYVLCIGLSFAGCIIMINGFVSL